MFLLAFTLAILHLPAISSSQSTGLVAYPLCAAEWIAGGVDNTPSCLPPNADCMCYLDAFNLESIAIHIASKCNASEVTDTASIMQDNCAILHQTPAVNSDEFTNLAFHVSYDTITPSPTTIVLSTIPGVTVSTTDSDFQSIISPSGVTVAPSRESTGTQATSIGPVSFSSTVWSSVPVTSAVPTTTSRSAAGASSAIKQSKDRRLSLLCISVAVMIAVSVIA